MYVNSNLNPKRKKTFDCTVRAIAHATGLDMADIMKSLTEIYLKTGWFVNDRKCLEKYMLSLGLEKVSCQVQRGEKRPTVRDVSALTDAKTRIVCNCAGHFVACSDGNHYDTWDSGDKCVYTYYVCRSY